MKRSKMLWGSFLLFLAVGWFFLAASARAASPVDKWGQLKGVSTHGIAWFSQYVNKSCFKSFKKMGVNTIRLALYSDPGAGYSTSLYSKVEEGIRYASELGMYVILDWHILQDGNPKTHQKQALSFFTRFARKYGRQKNILYEICNEPNGNVTWNGDIRPYANKLIKRIRKYDKNSLVIVGTPTWSQDVDVVARNPLTQKNVVYALHFYAATHKDELRSKVKTAYQAGLLMLVSEFSICDASGNGGLDRKSATRWMRLLKQYKIGYVAWNISNKNETSALIKSRCKKTGNFIRSNLSPSGRWIARWWKK